MDGEVIPRKVGPYVVCGCVSENAVDEYGSLTINESEKHNRVYLSNGELLTSLLGGGEYIIISLHRGESVDSRLLPKLIGAVQARIGRLYRPDNINEEADEIGSLVEEEIREYHHGSYSRLLHQLIPGTKHILIIGMTEDNPHNKRPNSYFQEFTDELTSLMLGLMNRPSNYSLYA